MPGAPAVVGLDAGGTKTALLARAGSEEVRRTGPGANLQRDGLAETAEVLAALVGAGLAELSPSEGAVVCAGVAGAGRPDEQAALAAALRARIGDGARVEVVADGLLALEAAFGPAGSGLVAAVGTGSVVLARTEAAGREPGRVLRAGGWGSRIGDPGSGTALGRAALAALAADLDGGPRTALRARLAETHGVRDRDGLIRLVYADGLDPAALAPLVVQTAAAGDGVAARVLHREADALAEQAAWLTARCRGSVTRRVALAGGLMAEAPYREVLAEALLGHLPGWEVTPSPRAPVEAALARAERMG